jgi:hypothetical protein
MHEMKLGDTLMPRWEYISINLNDLPSGSDEVAVLKDAGDAGWELVTVTTKGIAYLKRHIEPPARARQRKRESSAE